MNKSYQEDGWRRSSRCESHNCVEVAHRADRVQLRSSQDPDGLVVEIDPDSWMSFCAAIKAGALRGASG